LNASSDTALLLVQTAHFGAVMLVCVVLVYDVWLGYSRSTRNAAVYLALSVLCSLGLGGSIERLLDVESPGAAQSLWTWGWSVVVAATATAGVEGVRTWLGFPGRGNKLDGWMRAVRAINASLLVATAVGALLTATLFPQWEAYASWVLLPVGIMSAISLMVCAWVSVQVAKIGDRIARVLIWGAGLQAPGIGVTQAIRAAGWTEVGGWPVTFWGALVMTAFAIAAAIHAIAAVAIARVAILETSLYSKRRRALERTANFDALARLPQGPALVNALQQGFERASARRVAPAVLIINVYNHDTIAQERGAAAATQVLLATLARVQSAVSPRDLVGRYFDSCFVVLVRAHVDAQYLRNLALRLASSVARDVALRGRPADQGDNTPVQLDVSVGISWSDRMPDIKTTLRHAAVAAGDARRMEPPAAVCIYPEMPPLPVDRVLGASPMGMSARDHMEPLNPANDDTQTPFSDSSNSPYLKRSGGF
jgi:GGDEF domain-containing protein